MALDVEKTIRDMRALLVVAEKDELRLEYLHGLGVCLLCGGLHLPCYCAPQYDE